MNDNNMRDDEGSAAGGACEIVLLTISIILIVITFPISIFFCIRIVQEYERAVIFRLGRIKKVKKEFIYYAVVITKNHDAYKIDMS